MALFWPLVFVEYVIDSTAKRILGDEDIGEHVITEDEFGEEIDPPVINWQEKVDYDDEEVREALADMYYQSSEQFYRRQEIDTRKLLFEYYWIDLQEAARKAGRDQDLNAGGYTNSKGQNFSIMGHSDRSKFIIKEVINPVFGPLMDLDLDAARRIVETNCLAALAWVQNLHADGLAERGGSIVNVRR